MLFFSHLVIGIFAGIILAFLFNDSRVVIFTAVGSVLPDLIDKPVGYILLGDWISNGRIFFHGFWLMLFLLVAGVVIFIRLKNSYLLAFSLGITVHQIADTMWNSPVNWFWPMFGPYPKVNNSVIFFSGLILKRNFIFRRNILFICNYTGSDNLFSVEEKI